MHSVSQEREVFKFILGLSVLIVIACFNNCGGSYSQSSHVEMSSKSPRTGYYTGLQQ